MIYLETDRLILRDYTIDDFEAYYKLKADPQTMYYLQDIQLHSFDEAILMSRLAVLVILLWRILRLVRLSI